MSIRELFRKESPLSRGEDSAAVNPINDANAKRERLLAVARIGRRQPHKQ